jgi:cold shock CspA family protein
MAEGTIKTLNRERGYGFIMADGESGELYFDRLAVVETPFDELEEEQRVMFTTAPDPLKPERLRGEDIRVVTTE